MADHSQNNYKAKESLFITAVDTLLSSLKNRLNKLTTKSATFNTSTLTLEDNYVYVYNGAGGVSSLHITYPDSDCVATVLFSTAKSGTIKVTFKQGTKFVGSAAYEFFPGENWELHIHNGRVVGSQIT